MATTKRKRDAAGRFIPCAKEPKPATPTAKPMTVTNPGDSGGVRVTNGNLVAGKATVSFAARYSTVEIRNNSTTAGEIYFVRTDGVAPASPWADCYACAAGERILAPNCAGIWYQGYGAFDGTQTNPGTTVKIASSNASSTAGFEVVGTS